MFKATILVDNIPHDDCEAEWGFSVQIDYQGHSYLLDTGSSDLYLTNAGKLGVSIADVDAAVLSHAHCDPSGGYDSFFRETQKATLYVSGDCREDCSFKLGLIRKYVGVPRGLMAGHEKRIIHAPHGLHQLADGVWLVPHLPNRLEIIGRQAHMYRRLDGRIVPDDFSHEQSLVFDTPKGLVLLNSCSHGGLPNIVRDVQHYLPGHAIYMTIGGLHLAGMRKSAVRDIAAAIKTLGIEHVVTGHCTGDKAFKVLHEELGDKVQQTFVGQIIEV